MEAQRIEILNKIDDRLAVIDVKSDEIDEHLVKLGEMLESRDKKKREKRIKELLAKRKNMTYTDVLELRSLEVKKRTIMNALGAELWRMKHIKFDTPDNFYRGLTEDREVLEREAKHNDPLNLTKKQRQIAKNNGISEITLYKRIVEMEWDAEKAITEPLRKRNSWTKEEDQIIIDAHEQGKSNSYMATKTGRSYGAVTFRKTQLKKQGLIK